MMNVPGVAQARLVVVPLHVGMPEPENDGEMYFVSNGLCLVLLDIGVVRHDADIINTIYLL